MSFRTVHVNYFSNRNLWWRYDGQQCLCLFLQRRVDVVVGGEGGVKKETHPATCGCSRRGRRWCKEGCRRPQCRSFHRAALARASGPSSPHATPAGQALSPPSGTLCAKPWFFNLLDRDRKENAKLLHISVYKGLAFVKWCLKGLNALCRLIPSFLMVAVSFFYHGFSHLW